MHIETAAPIGSEHKFYSPASPCNRGHKSVRRLTTNLCLQCERENSVKRKKRDLTEYQKAHYLNNRATYLARNKKHREENPDYQIKWRHSTGFKQNPESKKVHKSNRRARLSAAGGEASISDIEFLKEAQRMQCATCKACLVKAGFHIDHVISIAMGGTGDRLNLQLLCPDCNWKKGAMHPIDWAQKNGMLC